MELLILVDAWPHHWLFSWSVGGLGDVVLHVGSSVLGCLAGLGGLVRSSVLWSSFC